MNIGILTHCIANNFGANLQALSTAYYLKNNGYTPIFFYWDSYLKKRSVKMHKEQLDMHRNFLKDNGFIVTRPCVTDDDFIDVIKHYEIKNIIIGSDAVFTLSTWVDRVKISRHGISFAEVTEDKLFPNPFWVPFINRVSNCKFFYMSPSCQSSNDIFFSKKLKINLKLQLEQSSYLSARDSATQKMLQKILERNVDVPLTPDPVWGFSYNVNNIPPKEYIIKKYNIKNDYMLVSYYNSNTISFEWHDEFRRIANKKGIEVYSLPMPQGHFVSNLPKINLPINSLDWFALIKYSKGYVGHNMHPVIVSLHNIVPFFFF